jgi:hypothetical protein
VSGARSAIHRRQARRRSFLVASRTLLGDAFIAVELPSTKATDHSVLTEQRDESVARVIDFFVEKLLS